MITSKKCWLKEECVKYLNPQIQCDCRDADVYCKKLFKLNYLYNQALLTDKQYKEVYLFLPDGDADRAMYTQLAEIKQDIVNFVKNGNNVYIHSPICGNGKTEWSLKLLRAYLNSIWPYSSMRCHALFINVPKFLLSLKDSISNQNDYINHIKANILDADLVVWDEIGIKSLTEYEHENLLNLINARLDNNKANIYTSNLSNEELQKRFGERLYSRIVKLSREIIFSSYDKRGAIVD